MTIETQIQRYIADNLLFSEGLFEYDNDASFLHEGILDSVGVMELVAFIESTYDIPVMPDDVTPQNFDSVNKLANFVRRKGSAKPQLTANA